MKVGKLWRMVGILVLSSTLALAEVIEVEWIKQDGTPTPGYLGGHDYGQSVAIDSDGNIYVTGYTTDDLAGENAGYDDIFISKYLPDGTKEWTKQYGTASTDKAYGISIDGNNNIYITGCTKMGLDEQEHIGSDYLSEDIFISKYLPDGTKEWTKQYGTSTYDGGTAVSTDNQGNIYVTGYTAGRLAVPDHLTSDFDIFLTKFLPDGSIAWTRQYGSVLYDSSYDVTTDHNGDIFVLGKTSSSQFYCVKVSPDGETLWSTSFGPDTGQATGYGIDTDNFGNIYITGATNGAFEGYARDTNDPDIFLTRYNADGTYAWTKQFGTATADHEEGYDVTVDRYDNIYVTGYTLGAFEGSNSGYRDMYISKFLPNGTQSWIKQYGSSGEDVANSGAVDQQGDIYITGYTQGAFGDRNDEYVGSNDIFLMKLGVKCRAPMLEENPIGEIDIWGEKQSDYDGDKRSDILWRHRGSGYNWIYLMDGTTICTSKKLNSASLDWSVAGIGDFNGDSHSDILWRNSQNGKNYVYMMFGSTIIQEGEIFPVHDQNWEVKGVKDFDGDRKADVLWRNSVTGENYLWIMNGFTIASEGAVKTVSDMDWQIQGVSDFDGDGKSDILWRNLGAGYYSGINYLWLMDGLTIASEGEIETRPNLDWQIQGVSDFNGDGKSDILWRNFSTGTYSGINYLYLMDGTTIVSQGVVNRVTDMDWQIKGTGDYDGDGKADILWRYLGTGLSSGLNYLYMMDGLSVIADGSINEVADMDWEIVNK